MQGQRFPQWQEFVWLRRMAELRYSPSRPRPKNCVPITIISTPHQQWSSANGLVADELLTASHTIRPPTSMKKCRQPEEVQGTLSVAVMKITVRDRGTLGQRSVVLAFAPCGHDVHRKSATRNLGIGKHWVSMAPVQADIGDLRRYA